MPDLVHFYSYATGVSLELPVGFEFAGEDGTSATYADLPDDGVVTDLTPRVQIRVAGRTEQERGGRLAFADRQQAVRALADGFAAVSGEVVERRDRTVDGEPACTVVLHRADGGYLHTTAIADGDRLVTVGAAGSRADLLPAYDAAVDSIRLIPFAEATDTAAGADLPDGTGWTSLASADLLISLRVPLGWDGDPVDEHTLRVYRDPADRAPDGTPYRASLGVSRGAPEQLGPEWFEEFCAAVPARLAEASGFELLGTDRFRLSSGAAVFAITARQHAAGAPATSQLLAYAWANSYRMYVFDAATLRPHESRDLPDFQAILGSVRVLPARA